MVKLHSDFATIKGYPVLLFDAHEDKPINCALELIETPLFESQRKLLISDDEFRLLQSKIIKNPQAGNIIVGTGGLRKIRLPSQNKGKSGGHRVIYLLAVSEKVYMITIYKKGQKDTLTQAEKNAMKKLTSLLKNEV